MAVYQFGALSDGQAISFNPTADRLNFDQTTIAAGDLSLVMEGSNLHVIVKSGPVQGKDIFLNSTSLEQIAGGINFTFVDGSAVRIGDNAVGTSGDAAGNGLTGGAGRDLLMGLGGSDTLQGGDGNDSVVGGTGNDNLNGNNGNDWLEGGAGNDTLTGSGGQDTFIFREAGTVNADSLPDFASNWDAIRLDAAGFSAIGAAGRFTASDPRFFAGTGAHDADDRIIYNSATGQIWYDADGNGAGAAQLIATLGAGRSVVAADFNVIGTAGGGGSGNTINGTAGDDSILGTSGPDTINGLGGNDTIDGNGGGDSISGGAGNDSMWSGAGNDTIDGGEGNDTLWAQGGSDSLIGGAGDDVFIRALDSSNNTLLGGDGNDSLRLVSIGGDTLDGGAGIDTLQLIGNSTALPGGADVNLAAGTITSSVGNASVANVENVIGSGQNDRITGNAGANVLNGGQDNDTIDGGAGNDTIEGSLGSDSLTGGSGVDDFYYNDVSQGGPDTITDFASGVDQFHFDAAFIGLDALGTTGQFNAGDVRFFAGAGATAGHDADDRIVFNTTTRQIFFDADGNGSGAGQLVATLQPGATLAATDIWVDNGSDPAATINGTPGNDTLVGGSGSDTINGLGGDDSIRGGEGADSMNGGDGNDTLDGYNHRTFDTDPDVETLVGGLGNDVFMVDNAGDVVSDTGGVDTVRAGNISWTLASGFENLVLDNDEATLTGIGNELNNVIGELDHGWHMQLEGRGGDDTIFGGFQNDTLLGGDGNDSLEGGEDVDTIDGGAGNDTLGYAGGFGDDDMWGGSGADHFEIATPGQGFANRVHDFETGVDKLRLDGDRIASTGASGNFSVNDARFFAGTAAHDADDRVIWDGSVLWYDPDGTGSATQEQVAWVTGSVVATDIEVVNGSGGGGGSTINGTAGNDTLTGTDGNDTINGNAGNDTLRGLGGDDSLDGGSGADSLDGGLGNDIYVVSTGDILTDAGGTDLIYTPVSWSLAGSFENLELTGTAATSASGNFLSNHIVGNGAANTLRGRDGNDTLTGGGGADFFDFTTAPSAGNADTVTDFVSGVDRLRFEDAAHTAIGATGNWAAGDGRFFAAAGATAGHDVNDRVIYNTSTGALYYDADGSGAGAAQLVATLQGAPTLAATDISVI